MKLTEYEERLKKLERLIAGLEKELRRLPKGNLRVVREGTSYKYYLVTKKGDTNGKYIRRENMKLIQDLAQREYYTKLLKESKREKKAIEAFLREMRKTSPEEVYGKLNEGRQLVVKPALISDEEYKEWWLAQEFETNPYNPEERVHDTNRGEKVRGKTEARIADLYYELGIPYRYECPLVLKNGKTKYPDFILLKLPERKEIIHEHLGLLEEAEYRERNLIKLRDYNNSGFYFCDNLLITYETEYAPLNMGETREMLKAVFGLNKN